MVGQSFERLALVQLVPSNEHVQEAVSLSFGARKEELHPLRQRRGPNRRTIHSRNILTGFHQSKQHQNNWSFEEGPQQSSAYFCKGIPFGSSWIKITRPITTSSRPKSNHLINWTNPLTYQIGLSRVWGFKSIAIPSSINHDMFGQSSVLPYNQRKQHQSKVTKWVCSWQPYLSAPRVKQPCCWPSCHGIPILLVQGRCSLCMLQMAKATGSTLLGSRDGEYGIELHRDLKLNGD